jgi:hypothetical protein
MAGKNPAITASAGQIGGSKPSILPLAPGPEIG